MVHYRKRPLPKKQDSRGKRLHLALPPTVADRFDELRRQYPGKTNGQLVDLLMHDAGDPRARALELLDRTRLGVSDQLPDVANLFLGMAIAIARRDVHDVARALTVLQDVTARSDVVHIAPEVSA